VSHVWDEDVFVLHRPTIYETQIKRLRRTPLQVGGAYEAPSHRDGTISIWSIPKLNTYALYPRRKHRVIAIKLNPS
jgi:hypothetical protein